MTASTDFLIERRLAELSPELHSLYRNSVFATDRLLTNYKSLFPFFTNHTFEHSAQVINYCNIIAGSENINRLNADEIYILLMGACLHDVGMGISDSDFNQLMPNVKGAFEYFSERNGKKAIGETTRAFHQEFSVEFIKKYHPLFEIPSDDYVYCICQVARGHRRMNLLDETEFNSEYILSNGNSVNLAYITALVKLADELDITSDRNLFFDYTEHNSEWSKKQTMCFKCHEAIKFLETAGSSILLHFQTDDGRVYEEILKTKDKVRKTFDEFAEVVRERSNFKLEQTAVRFIAD